MAHTELSALLCKKVNDVFADVAISFSLISISARDSVPYTSGSLVPRRLRFGPLMIKMSDKIIPQIKFIDF